MFSPSYHNRAYQRTQADLAAYHQGRSERLYSIARTFLLDGNLREAVQFQKLGATASASAREALFAA